MIIPNSNQYNVLVEYSADVETRMVFSPEEGGFDNGFPYLLSKATAKLNHAIAQLNLLVDRNIPYISISHLPCVNELTRLVIRRLTEVDWNALLFQIDPSATSLANVSHILDLFQCGGRLYMDKSDQGMNAQITFDDNLIELVIIDIFLDVAMFNSYSFLRTLPLSERKQFSKDKYNYFMERGLNCLFTDESNGTLDYYSFAFSCHSNRDEIISAPNYEYELNLEQYIGIWDAFLAEYYPKHVHMNLSITEQLTLRINNHLPLDLAKKFHGKQSGIYFLLRTERMNIPKKYESQVCSLFGIPKCTVGHLHIIPAKDFTKYQELYLNAGISAYKVIVP